MLNLAFVCFMKVATHYRLSTPVRAVRLVEHPGSSLRSPTETLIEIPAESVIETEGPASSSGLINVIWNGNPYSVFFDDLRDCGEVIDSAAC